MKRVNRQCGPPEPPRRRPIPDASPTVPLGTPTQQSADPEPPRKITITRVAAWRSRQFAGRSARLFRNATTADGAGRSGLSSLTYTTMVNYAADMALAVALANTLFFAAATAESRTNVALYLLITVAPFAAIAPVIGPLLDRLQRGRRVAMAGSFAGRTLLLVVLAMHMDDWLLYPAALGFMVLAKSYNVLKAAITPRVLPPDITLVKANSRLTVFGLAAGVVGGGAAGVVAFFAGSPGALLFNAVVCVGGVVLCLLIPGWVEVTDGHVPASLRTRPGREPEQGRRRPPMGRRVVTGLWGSGTARMLTGFLTLFVAFVVKAHTEGSPTEQVLLLGTFGLAAGAGSFLGNAGGARMHLGRPDQVILTCIVAGLVTVVTGALLPGIAMAAVGGLVAGAGSALAKVCLDATIQRDLTEGSRSSAFGRSETALQLAWVFGGALGVLLPPTYWIGFTVVSALLGVGLVQTLLARRGGSLLPGGARSPRARGPRRGRGRGRRVVPPRARGHPPTRPAPTEPLDHRAGARW